MLVGAGIEIGRFVDKEILVPCGPSVPGPVVRFLRAQNLDLRMSGQIPGERSTSALGAAHQHELRPRPAIDQLKAWVIQGMRMVFVCVHEVCNDYVSERKTASGIDRPIAHRQ